MTCHGIGGRLIEHDRVGGYTKGLDGRGVDGGGTGGRGRGRGRGRGTVLFFFRGLHVLTYAYWRWRG